jgi:lipopolysaccharide/colanic/teichoic acid biosynthesis glycosyltransferase
MYATAKDGSSEPDGKPLYAQPNDHRITKIGKFLRKTRLDELPQLWNILIGQMSFIGPRPERIEFVQECEKVTPYYQIRHIDKPGLTGWAQVNFRYGTSVEDSIEKLQYELYYIKHRSFVLDLSILLKTIKIVLGGLGR